MDACINCEHARRAVGDPSKYVCCGLWSQRDYSSMFDEGVSQAYEGWGYLGRRPENETGDGTVTSGLMTNYCVIVGQGDSCRKFVPRGESA